MMEHNMAKLLRASKYASHDPQIPQVWHNRTRFRAAGEWGFKRTVNPWRVKHSMVTLARMDDPNNYTHFDYAEKKVKAVRRFIKNFGNTPQPGILPPKPPGEVASFARDRFPESVDEMSLQEWDSYLNDTLEPIASELRREWATYKMSHGLEGKPFDELTDHCLKFLNLRVVHPGAAARKHLAAGNRRVTAEYLSTMFNLDLSGLNLSGSSPSPSLLSADDQDGSSEQQKEVRTYAGPTYSHPVKIPSRKVRGRGLNTLHGDRSHLVVAVSGVTASLLGYSVYQHLSNGSGALTREVAEFWVKSADTDRRGNPVVKLQSQSPLTVHTLRRTSFRRQPFSVGGAGGGNAAYAPPPSS